MDQRQKKVALTFGSVVTFIAVTVAFLGFPGFKSVGVIAVMLALSAVGASVFTIGFVCGFFSKKPQWTKVKKIGWMLAIAPLIYIAFELANPIL